MIGYHLSFFLVICINDKINLSRFFVIAKNTALITYSIQSQQQNSYLMFANIVSAFIHGLVAIEYLNWLYKSRERLFKK